MRPALRTTAVLLIPALLAVASSVCAAPVTVDQAPGQTEGANAGQSTLPGLLPSAPADGLRAPGGEAKAAGQAAPVSGDSNASNAALAAEIIKETEADMAAAEPARKPQRASARAASQPGVPIPPARRQAGVVDDEQGLREIGKAAVHWLKQTVPWLRSDGDESDGDRNVRQQAADWSASPLEGGKSGGNAFAGSTHPAYPTGQVPTGPGSTLVYGSTAPPTVFAPEENLVKVVAKVVREVLEHPMTWLVVSLVVVGAIAVKKLDRRPK